MLPLEMLSSDSTIHHSGTEAFPPPLTQAQAQMKADLGASLKLLFVLSGATTQLSQLALLSIVNDRVSIPPLYLTAYSAIAFLPYSLKPIYAFLGLKMEREKGNPKKMLLAVLLAINGVAYIGTAWLMPPGGIVICFLWAFVRGIASAWSQFVMNENLIHEAQQKQQLALQTYQELASIFQSQAMTYSNLGSLLASLVSISIFAYRQEYYTLSSRKVAPLSESLVVGLLLASAVLCMAGAAIAAYPTTLMFFTNTSTSSASQQAITYDAVSTTEYPQEFDDQYGRSSTLDEPCSAPVFPIDDSNIERSIIPSNGEGGRIHGGMTRHQTDTICLVLLQIILVGTALKDPIVSLVKNQLVWNVPMIALGICLLGILASSSISSWDDSPQDSEGIHRDSRGTSRLYGGEVRAISPRPLGIHLILWHSVPIASILMYYYIYTIFGDREPVFLQILMMIEAGASMVANWVYGRYFAERFHSGWGIIGLRAVLGIVAALASLLNIIIVRAVPFSEDDDRGSSYEVGTKLRVLVVSISCVTYFMGQIAYMPSVVLATANVISSSEAAYKREEETATTAGCPGSIPADTGDAQDNNTTIGLQYDEGVQYASFVSCIGFGSQLGDWIAVPIIKHLNVTRENHWANLDRYIILCAVLRIVSIVFLWPIRPTKGAR